jgi:hypothetical protein
LTHPTRSTVSVVSPIVFACALLLFVGSLMGQTSSGNSKTTQKFSASAIQIEPPDPGDVPMPPEFRMAIYESLITHIEKTGKFQHVYRSGDKDAASVPDLVTLRTTAQSFKKGSQKKREVTTVTGTTSMSLKVHINDHAGQTIVDRNVKGQVHFLGENLRATYDFATKVADIVQEKF